MNMNGTLELSNQANPCLPTCLGLRTTYKGVCTVHYHIELVIHDPRKSRSGFHTELFASSGGQNEVG